MAGEKIGVLLPVRLETKFIPPANAGEPWHLDIAVIPDEASMDRHAPTVSAGELDRLEAAWRACKGDLTSADGRDAFLMLAGEVGAARASWLLRTFPPLAGDIDWNAPHVIDWDAASAVLRAPGESALSRISGLPEQIEIWLGIDENGKVRLEPLTEPLSVKQDKLAFADNMSLFTEDLWWIKDAGLAARLELPFTTKDELRTIAFIAAVGLGDGRPQTLFQDHRDAGVISLLQMEQPTNSISGEPAADLGRDPETWWRLTATPSQDEPVQKLAYALTGSTEALDPLPGAAAENSALGSYLPALIWPAVWGHTLRDIWGADVVLGSGFTARLGFFGLPNPEGPLPPVRLGAEAYGVLPVSSLDDWQQSSNPTVLDDLVRNLADWRDVWARLAEENSGTVVEQNTERLLDLLARVPTSSGYDYSSFIPLQILLAMSAGLGSFFGKNQPDPNNLCDKWEERTGEPARHLLRVKFEPIRRYVTHGGPQPNELPLVEPNEPLSEQEAIVLDEGGSIFFDWLRSMCDTCMNGDIGVSAFCNFQEFRQPYPPNSLLLRLLFYSGALAHADLIQLMQGQEGALTEPLIADKTLLCELLLTDFEGHRMTFQDVLDAAGPLGDVVGKPEYDICVYWIQAIQALLELYQAALDSGPPALADLLAAVERIFRATLDAALMRPDPWITSMAALRLRRLRSEGAADGLGIYGWVDRPYTGRPGPTTGGVIHAPSEAQLRAAVVLRDKAVSDPASKRWQIELDSRLVRMAAYISGEVRGGSPLQEVLGRVIEEIIADPEKIRQLRGDKSYWMRREHAGRRVVDGQKVLADKTAVFAKLALDETARTAIAELDTVLNAYADLLVANAVYNVTNGRPEKAGEIMEAAAGLELPPELDLLLTPRQGRGMSTRVLLALRDTPAPADLAPGVSPAELADAATAAFLARQWPAGTRRWTTSGGKINLSHLGLTPADTLSLSEDVLIRLVESDTGGKLLEDETLSPGLAMFRRIKRQARLLAAGCLQEQAEELRTRYGRLHAAAKLMLEALQNRQPDALFHARRWGIVPAAAGVDDAALDEQFASVFETLNDRISAAPSPDKLTEKTPAHQIAAAISELASPGGSLPVYGRSSYTDLLALLPRYDLANEPDMKRFTRLKFDADLDQTWLEVVATVRPNLARLESWQLEGGSQHFFAWSNQKDPWEPQPLPETQPVKRTSQLVVVYGQIGVLNASKADRMLAVGELDAWAETVPDENHATAAAFGFNAPAAQAPQAILIAVTPDKEKALDGNTLAQIVQETRTLAHARMAVPADVGQYAGIFPFTMLPTHESTGMTLKPTLP